MSLDGIEIYIHPHLKEDLNPSPIGRRKLVCVSAQRHSVPEKTPGGQRVLFKAVPLVRIVNRNVTLLVAADITGWVQTNDD